MTLSLPEFTQRLADSGLLTPDEIAASRGQLPAEQHARDAQEFARELVRLKKLTRFQAEQIYAGKGKSLTLGNYVILDKLGQGGMGMVLKAQHKRMKRLVALKVMSPAAVKSPDAVKRFHREVQAAAKLDHPNIVAAYDADEAHGTHFFVMQFVEGSDLSAIVKQHGPMSVELALECILQAARGLEYAHRNGVIHRDIKPANLLLATVDGSGSERGDRSNLPQRPEGCSAQIGPVPFFAPSCLIKILDMGLARIEASDFGPAQAELTSTGQIMGTVDYMSPEQAEDTRHADARSDIYSLGCSLYYLLTGQAVYCGESMMKKLLAHRDAPLPSLRVLRNDVSTALEAVCHRMLAKKPSDRPQNMTQVIAELERCRVSTSPTIGLDTNSAESVSGNELQKFLRQISSEEGPPADGLLPANTKGTAVLAAAGVGETVFVSAGEAGTDPQPEMSLAAGHAHRRQLGAAASKKLTAIWASIVVVLLLGIVFVVRGKSGTLHIEITDDATEVTVGDTGRIVKGPVEEEIRLPVGEHVLHVKRDKDKLKFDSTEFSIAKGETVSLKVERVGREVRVMQGETLLGRKEPPRAKSSAGKTSDLAAQNYALEFDGKASHVEIPTLERHQSEPLTLEAWVKSAKPAGVIARMEGRASAQIHVAYNEALTGGEIGSPQQELHRYVNAGSKLSAEVITHVAYVIDERGAKLFLNGVRVGNIPGAFAKPISQTPFRGTWLSAQPNDQGKTSSLFPGVMDEVRISKVARYDKDFTPDVRFTSDKDTLALYHFDEGSGDQLLDSSPNKHHGKIVGAKWVSAEEPTTKKRGQVQ